MHERFSANPAIAGWTFDETHGNLVVEKELDNFSGVAAMQRKLDARMLIKECPKQTWKNILCDRRRNSDRKLSSDLSVLSADLSFHVGNERRYFVRVTEKDRALRSQGDTVAGTIEKTHSELVLECFNLESDGGLRKEKMLCGFAKAQVFSHYAKDFEPKIFQLGHASIIHESCVTFSFAAHETAEIAGIHSQLGSSISRVLATRYMPLLLPREPENTVKFLTALSLWSMSIRSMRLLSAILLAALVAVWAGCGGSSHHFVYAVGPNTQAVFGFEENSSGVLSTLSGSPFSTGGSPVAVAVNPAQTFGFVISAGGNGIVVYTFDKKKGLLTLLNAAVATGTTPVALAVDPSSQHVYVLNKGSNNISAFSIDPTLGTLTAISGSPFPTVTGPVSMAMAPKGNALYVVSPTQGVAGLTVNSDGTLAAGSAPLAAGSSPAFVTVDPSGSFVYVADSVGNAVLEFTASGASLTAAGSPVPAGTMPTALAVNPDGKLLFAANQGSNNVSVFSIASGGALSPVQGSPFTTGTGPDYVAVDHDGSHLFVADAGSNDIAEFSISSNGSLAQVAGSPISIATNPRWIEVTP